jgi:hypothetical protein
MIPRNPVHSRRVDAIGNCLAGIHPKEVNV